MRYVAAYLLAALGGKDNPSSADIEKILSSVGIEADSEKLTKVINELKGKNVEEVITKGTFLMYKILFTLIISTLIFTALSSVLHCIALTLADTNYSQFK